MSRDPDDTLPEAPDTIPAPPPSGVECSASFDWHASGLKPVTFLPHGLQVAPDESGRFDADAFASDLLDDD